MLIRLSTPTALAVSVDAVKERIRVTHDDHDGTLQSLVKSETRRYEDFTHRFMVPIELEFRTSGWSDPIVIPAAPVREVTAVKYLDTEHVEQTLDAGEWYFEASADGGSIWFTSAFSSPNLSDRENPVRVEFSAGYDDPAESGSGDDPELAPVPRDATNITMLVQRIYDCDEQVADDEMRKIFGHRRIFR